MNEYYELYSFFIYATFVTLVCWRCSSNRVIQQPQLRVHLNEYPSLLNQHSETCFHKEGDCIICLEDYGDKELRVLKCFHSFHKDCIDRWIETSKKMECPICSYNIL